MDRPQYYRFHQGRNNLPFADSEYASRLRILRQTMQETGVDASVLTSMHDVSYYSGFLYCSFGRSNAQVVTPTVTISAGIDAAQTGAMLSVTISPIQIGKDKIIGGPFFLSQASATMKQRMHKSSAELALIRACAATADVGGYAIRDQIQIWCT